MHTSDYLVIGSGIAGLSFALKAANHGCVTIITKGTASDSNTSHAQGGIACVSAADDDPELHIQDTLNAGAGICNEAAVRLMVQEAPNCIQELLEIGVHFSQQGEKMALGKEGGHSRHRILHCHDMTGKEIEQSLLRAVNHHGNIRLFENHTALDLILSGTGAQKECVGAWVLNESETAVIPFLAKFTVLCTGGSGQVYRHTTNPAVATGDGIAMAWRAGAEIADMEFVQFHPTTLYRDTERSLLITEALRGAGAILRNAEGEDFMKKYHPMGSLAPRDVVSRAILAEMQRTESPCVYLDAENCENIDLAGEFPLIYRQCLTYGIDINNDMIPVVPAAHYMCGGVRTGLSGLSSIPRLYAFGETACTGVHGANRLASNSLLEALVFSKQAYLHTLKEKGRTLQLPLLNAYANHGAAPPMDEIQSLRHSIQQIMWDNAGIERRMTHLNKSLKRLDIVARKAEHLYRQYALTAPSVELYNLSITARQIIQAALRRRESLGLHYLMDEELVPA